MTHHKHRRDGGMQDRAFVGGEVRRDERLLFAPCRRDVLAGLFASLANGVRAADEPEVWPAVEVAPGVFVAVGAQELATPSNGDRIGNAGFVVGDDAVAVIDTGGSFLVGQQLLRAVRAQTQKPIRFVINTHDHPDHILGNAAFVAPGTTFVGHRKLAEALTARAEVYLAATKDLIGESAFAGTRVVSPTMFVADRLVLELGNRPLLLEAWPEAHTDTDLTVLDQRTSNWFLGDLLFSGHVPALDGSLKGWLAAIDAMRKRQVARAVPGHGPALLPWPEALDPMERYLRILSQDVRTGIRTGQTMRETAASAAGSERGRWLLFEDFNPRNATSAFHELEWETP